LFLGCWSAIWAWIAKVAVGRGFRVYWSLYVDQVPTLKVFPKTISNCGETKRGAPDHSPITPGHVGRSQLRLQHITLNHPRRDHPHILMWNEDGQAFQNYETVIILQERLACWQEQPLLKGVRVGYGLDQQQFQISWVDLNGVRWW
jgi:hypothetical protein